MKVEHGHVSAVGRLPDDDVVAVTDPEPGYLVVVVASRKDRPGCVVRCATPARVKDRRVVGTWSASPHSTSLSRLRVIRTR